MRELLSVFILMVVSFSCKTDNKQLKVDEQEFNYAQTTLPGDTTQLWIEHGKLNSDTVLLICQGGPARNLTFSEHGKTSYRYIPEYSNYRIAYVHQAQTLNSEIFNYQEEFTLEMAEKEVENTTEILHRALHYFKSREKRTVVIGNSYGAYIVLNYLSEKPSLADKYVIVAGRLDDDPKILEQHLRGYNGHFALDGTTYIPESEQEDLNNYSAAELKEYRVKQLLKGAIGRPRYSNALANKDLSNITFFYATNDQNVGRLTESELTFLTSKNVEIFETNTGHSETLYRFIDTLRAGKLKL